MMKYGTLALTVLLLGACSNSGNYSSGDLYYGCRLLGGQYYGSQRWLVERFVAGTPVQHVIIPAVAERGVRGQWSGGNLEIPGLASVPPTSSGTHEWALTIRGVDVNVNAMPTRRIASATAERVELQLLLRVFDECAPAGRVYSLPLVAVRGSDSVWLTQFPNGVFLR